MPTVSFRQARIVLAVTRNSSVTGAAKAINRSQTSVTKSIQDLERELDTTLFDRSPRGVSLTTYGEALYRGAEEAARVFERASGLIPPIVARQAPGVTRFFHMDVSDKWLDAFLATVEHQNLGAAAQHLDVTTAAVAASLRKLEDSLHTTLFEKSPNATVPTSFSLSLASYVKLARSHLRHACAELDSLKGVHRGSVAVGTLPLMRTIILPRAIARLRTSHPYVDISTLEGPYDDLAAALRCGDIDLIIGALRGSGTGGDLAEETLFHDRLSIIVRADHPLMSVGKIELPELLNYEWIMPRRGTPTRRLIESAMIRRKLPMPEHIVETSSLVILRGLLTESDSVTALSRHQIYFEEASGMLAALPIDIPETRRPIGITRRAAGSIPPVAELLMAELRNVVAESGMAADE
ncbi:MAG: LysR family transcriptional regulator [Gammaproteobacteria bacterium]|nr:LysR family transcriptional regulator [Gammaproteobacteria bacterium]